MATVNNAKELGQAIDRNEGKIIIEGKLGELVIKIVAVGKVAWLVAGGAIAVAIIAILAAPAAVPMAGPMGLVAEGIALGAGGAGAVGVLGVPATVAAISIGVGAGSKVAVNKMRNNYNLTKAGSKVILTRKK